MDTEHEPIYLDHNATTPLLPEVLEAMLPYLREHFGNPSSTHVYGRRAREAVETARAQVAALLGCAPDEICFTSGGTESNNLAIRGALAANPGRCRVVTSTIEHGATASPCRLLERQGFLVLRATVDAGGRLRPPEVADLVSDDTAVVSIIHAHNETGVIQPVAEIARIATARGALVHVDGAQSVGKIPVDVGALGVDLLSVASHKMYGPKGVGALYIRRYTQIEPLVLGAGQEQGRRPGTHNVPAIVGFGAACAAALRDLEEVAARLRALRDRLFGLLRERIPGLRLNGDPERRLPGTLSVRFPGVSGRALLDATPAVAASTASACQSGAERPPEHIVAMGVPPAEALGTVRLSLGRGTTAEHVERAAELLTRSFVRLTASA